MVLVASAIFVTGITVLAQQRADQDEGPGPGGLSPDGRGAMPAYYINRIMPPGPVQTAAADRACQSRGHARLVCLADLLKKDLSPGLLARLQLPYTVADAQRWSNFPAIAYRNRIGPTLAEFTPAQLGVVKAMLKQAAGMAASEGHDQTGQILDAGDYLQDSTRDAGFASGNFQIAFIGTPSDEGQWQLYFVGHHLAFSNTYKDGVLTGAPPSSRGVEPFTAFKEKGRDNAPMNRQRGRAASILARG